MSPLHQSSISPLALLQSHFGYQKFLEGQEEIINNLIAGNDALVLMPTGGGKSLCYQIPSIIRPGVGIIVSPLIALMQNQVDAMLEVGIKAAFLNSTLTYRETTEIQEALFKKEIDLLYVAPERLLTERFQQMLQQLQVALFAIDEAHCVSQWGHDFRPEYIGLTILHEKFPNIPRIALTATADTVTRQEIILKLGLEKAEQYIFSFDRPNIKYRVKLKKNAKQQLLDFIRWEQEDNSGIVYCLSRKKVEDTAQWLCDHGFTALPYHAGLHNQVRAENQRRFLQEDGLIIVATIAFGMGIDKPDVRFVAHLDLPKSLEAYYQETGRAGRDGNPAIAWMVYSLGDVVMLRKMLENSEANEQQKWIEKRKLDALLGYCETSNCRRQVMLNYFSEELPEPCGNCDTCLEPVETWEGAKAAQKALSCVYRTGQRFGAKYLIDILLGNSNERIQRLNHDELSTYGIGTELSAAEWQSVFRQLIAADLLSIDIEGFGGFRLTEKCRGILKGEKSIRFRKDPTPKSKRNGKQSAKQNTGSIDWMSEDEQTLWKALRQFRFEQAKQQNVPAFVVLHDRTLKELIAARPSTTAQLRSVPGIGESKLKKYGKRLIEIINQT